MTNESDENKSREGDVAFIKSLAELLNSSDLAEITVKRDYGEHDRLTISLNKHSKQFIAAPVAAPSVAGASATQASQAPASAPASERINPADHAGAVKSPMVGTAYLSPEPGAPAFVQIGQKVSEGETLMIVEAMKTMNHIPAPHSGTVTRILVDDGSPIEFGATLMIVE